MQQQQQEVLEPTPAPHAQPPRRPFPWTRMVIMLAIAAVLISLSIVIWVSNGTMLNWSALAPFALGLIAALLPFVQWLFPLDPIGPRHDPPPDPPDTPVTPIHPPLTSAIFHFDETQLPSPAEFFGREYERGTLLTRISARSSTAIIGDYRIGKSWLLQYLIQSIPTHPQLGPRVHIGRLSATHPQSATLAGFVTRALEVLNVPSDYRASTRGTPMERLANAVRNLKQLGIIPVLCIDEFAGLIGKPDFEKNFIIGLRAIAEDDGLVLITASRHPLHVILHHLTGDTSPLFNIMQELTLKGFNEPEARHFVEQKSRLAGLTQEEQRFFLACALVAQADGTQSWPPLRLQLVGQTLLTEKQNTHNQHAYNVKDPVFQSAFKQRVEEAYQAVVSQS
ncbi:MAG TPA: AAA family ATPase [Ktedonobacteraceae bacterium]